MRFRSLLYSKWFFAGLFLVSIFDLVADLAELTRAEYWGTMIAISIVLSAVVAALAGWIFLDLHMRRPR